MGAIVCCVIQSILLIRLTLRGGALMSSVNYVRHITSINSLAIMSRDGISLTAALVKSETSDGQKLCMVLLLRITDG